jgi:hypothetical protein
MRTIGRLALCALVCWFAAGCITEGATSTDAAPEPPPATMAPSGIDTVPNRPPLLVERPEEVRDVQRNALPVPLRLNLALLALSEDEGKCIYTAIQDYIQGPGAEVPVDDERMVAALGGAILVCTDQMRLANTIALTVASSQPTLTEQQVDCIRIEIELADPSALAVFLGAFTYGDTGVEEMQQPFIRSFTANCGLA